MSEATTQIETTTTAEVMTEQENPYTFRKLVSTDVFLLAKIISKIGINEFTSCFESEPVKKALAKLVKNTTDEESEAIDTTDEDVTAVGISVILELANVILGNIPKCENEIYQLLANVSNMKLEAVKKLDAAVFFEMIIDFVKKEEFKDFFKVASKLFK